MMKFIGNLEVRIRYCSKVTIRHIRSTPANFPNNVQWSYAPDDAKRLRHMPDIWVRPGGITFGVSYSTSPISPNDQIFTAEGLELKVEPQLETIPIGAPVRVNIKLTNTSNVPLPVPPDLSMKRGQLRGKVIDPSGALKLFSSVVICIDEAENRMLNPGEAMNHSITLLRGPEGALFPSSGLFKIIVEVLYEVDGLQVNVNGECSVLITPPEDESHAKAARKILSTPDALLVLAIGGDHLQDGIDAIQSCLDNKVTQASLCLCRSQKSWNAIWKETGRFEKGLRIPRQINYNESCRS